MLATLPPTDCRLRPDIRAYEYGDLQLAASEKGRIEEKQRHQRKIREQQNKPWSPLWFDFEMKGPKVVRCSYNGTYWDSRQTNVWPEEMPDLFSNDL